MLFTYAPSVSQAQRDAIFLRMQAEGLVGCAMSALAAPTLADWRRITSPRRGLLLCCHAAEAGDSLEHFAFETVPGSTHHSGEKRGFRQNPHQVVAAAAFASAEQFQAPAVRRRRSLTDGDSIARESALKAPSVMAALVTTGLVRALAEFVFAAFYAQHLAVDQGVGQFFARLRINALHSGAGNLHFFGAGLLRKSFQIDESDGFILVHSHDHSFGVHAVHTVP